MKQSLIPWSVVALALPSRVYAGLRGDFLDASAARIAAAR
jgi:hypothetical protein